MASGFAVGDYLMHLSMLCPTTPHPGHIGEKVGHLTCFDTKTCPICGEFDRLPYACITIKSTDDQIPHLSSIFEWGEGWDLADWHAR